MKTRDAEGDILVVDIGGTHVKLRMKGQSAPTKIPTGPTMTARRMAGLVRQAVKGWPYRRVSIGYPGPVAVGRPLHDPANLGGGWVGFDFRKAFGRPVRLTNDAAMQALGGYKGGRMLFLGLGTGLGTALVLDGVLQPLEASHLPYRNGRTYEDYLGKKGYARLGKKKWRRHVEIVVEQLRMALRVDDVLIGGGNAKKLKTLPPGTRLGSNVDAFLGGLRLWRYLRASGKRARGGSAGGGPSGRRRRSRGAGKRRR
jgi:predicted NBD/HSP70 family sugar kinase